MAYELCSVCGVRYVQEFGRCRKCNREIGQSLTPAFEAQRLNVQKQQAKVEALKKPDLPVRPPKVIETGGLEFEIIFDGTRPDTP